MALRICQPLLAIAQMESGGTEDVMQSSESLGLPNSLRVQKNPLSKVWSISVNCVMWKAQCRFRIGYQSYNYGGGFVEINTFELAQSFSKHSGGEKDVLPQSLPINGGWRYNYGIMFMCNW